MHVSKRSIHYEICWCPQRNVTFVKYKYCYLRSEKHFLWAFHTKSWYMWTSQILIHNNKNNIRSINFSFYNKEKVNNLNSYGKSFLLLHSAFFNINRNKHNAQLQRTDPGTKVTGGFSTRGHIFHPNVWNEFLSFPSF